MTTPHPHPDHPAAATKSSSIFAHDYPVPVSIALMITTYLATVALPYRLSWKLDNVMPLLQAYGEHIHKPLQITSSNLPILVLTIPAILFFILEFTVMRSYPPVSRAIKITFIAAIIGTSGVIGLISPSLAVLAR